MYFGRKKSLRQRYQKHEAKKKGHALPHQEKVRARARANAMEKAGAVARERAQRPRREAEKN